MAKLCLQNKISHILVRLSLPNYFIELLSDLQTPILKNCKEKDNNGKTSLRSLSQSFIVN